MNVYVERNRAILGNDLWWMVFHDKTRKGKNNLEKITILRNCQMSNLNIIFIVFEYHLYNTFSKENLSDLISSFVKKTEKFVCPKMNFWWKHFSKKLKKKPFFHWIFFAVFSSSKNSIKLIVLPLRRLEIWITSNPSFTLYGFFRMKALDKT